MNLPVSYQIRIRGQLGRTLREALGLELVGVRRLPCEACAAESRQDRRESPGRVTPPHPGRHQAEGD